MKFLFLALRDGSADFGAASGGTAVPDPQASRRPECARLFHSG